MNERSASALVRIGVPALLLALALQLSLAASRNSASFDEPAHVYAGYLQWTHGFATLNPPLVRYLLAAPLLGMDLKEPPLVPRPIRMHEMLGGEAFVFGNDANAILFRSRMVVVALALLLALLVFAFTRALFGDVGGVIALGLLAFEPTFLGHSSLATTDTGQVLFLVAAVYAFHRFVRQPSTGRLLATGLAVGLAFAAKTSAVQLLPVLALLALVDSAGREGGGFGRRIGRLALALSVVGALAFVVLWASYGFHYLPKGGGIELIPSMEGQLARVPSRFEARVLEAVDHLHLLPRDYTYGFAHFLYEARAFTSYVWGTIYPHAVWFFFPSAMLIKSSLSFLALLLLAAWAAATGRTPGRRELVWFVLPAAVYMAIAMAGGMNIGIRHVLPVYVFLAAGIGGALSALATRDRRWRIAIAALLLLQALSVLRVFPAYVAYANEAFGGAEHVGEYLSDSNADWGQQMKAVKAYVDAHGVKDCWFSYFGQGPLDYRYYGIPCRPLVSGISIYFPTPFDVPEAIDGTVFVSVGTLTGFEFGPPPLQPFESFKSQKPVAVIDYGVAVYQGHFEIPLAAALSHVQKSAFALEAGDASRALAEARQAEALAPHDAGVLAAVAAALEASHEPDEAVAYDRKALALAQSTHPDFQAGLIAELQQRLAADGR